MIDSNGQPFSNEGGGADPMKQFFGNMATAWTRGLEAWQMFASHAGPGQGDQPSDPIGAMMAQLQTAAKSFEPFMSLSPDLAASSEAGQGAFKRVADLSPAMAKAYMVGVGSAVRYQSALAELFVQYGATLVQAATDRATGHEAASPSDSRVMADDMRAFVRGIGEAAIREARRLEFDLAKVGETIAEATDHATPSPYPYQHRRRHEVKP